MRLTILRDCVCLKHKRTQKSFMCIRKHAQESFVCVSKHTLGSGLGLRLRFGVEVRVRAKG